jgi:hypothetical protein
MCRGAISQRPRNQAQGAAGSLSQLKREAASLHAPPPAPPPPAPAATEEEDPFAWLNDEEFFSDLFSPLAAPIVKGEADVDVSTESSSHASGASSPTNYLTEDYPTDLFLFGGSDDTMTGARQQQTVQTAATTFALAPMQGQASATLSPSSEDASRNDSRSSKAPGPGCEATNKVVVRVGKQCQGGGGGLSRWNKDKSK